MEIRSLGYSTDLMVRRLAGSELVEVGDLLVVKTPVNPSFWWGNFVLARRSFGLEAAVRAFDDAFPSAGHLAIGIDSTDGAVPHEAASFGLRPDVSVVLTAPSDALFEAPAVDAELRVLTRPSDWGQLFDFWMTEASNDGPPAAVDVPYQKARVDEARMLSESKSGAFVGLFVGQRLVSALGVVSDKSGVARYQNVSTEPAYRRRGFASRLILEAARLARDRFGASTLVIVADPDGPAIGLYRSLGFRDLERQVALEGLRPARN